MLVDALLDANRESPQKLAVSDGRQTLSYSQLTSLAGVLSDVVAKETNCDRVGIMLPASALFPAAFFGALHAGKIAIPLNFLLSADELSRIVEDSGLDLIVSIGHFRELLGGLPARSILLEDLPLKRKVLFQKLRGMPPAPQVNPDDTAVLLYTSGTTAAPKGVQLTHENLRSNAVDTIAALEFDPDQRFLNILPPFHVFGLLANVIVPVFLRCSVFAIPRFSPVQVVKAVESHDITVMLAIPSMYAAMLRLKSANKEKFRSLILGISGGEPLPDRVRTAFEERFGVALREGYGLTETSPVIALATQRNYRPGTVGKPVRNVELRFVGDDGHDVPEGEEGELWVKGPGVMKGYYNQPEVTREVLDDDGWFRTGDIARLDEDGFLAITGRKKEMMIIGGENVFPREIEAVLEDHEDVLQAAVIGIPDDSRGEAPVAFVLCRDGATATEIDLRSHAKKALAGYKVPKQVHIRDDLPKSSTGKILKRKLADLLEG